MTKNTNRPKPPKGWRLLNIGERFPKDEKRMWNPHSKKWQKVTWRLASRTVLRGQNPWAVRLSSPRLPRPRVPSAEQCWKFLSKHSFMFDSNKNHHKQYTLSVKQGGVWRMFEADSPISAVRAAMAAVKKGEK